MLEAFLHLPLFRDLEIQQLCLLEPLFERYSCPPDTVIFEQGEQAAYLYIILRGSANILYKPHDGPAISITRLKAGDIFGWSAVIGSSTYTSGVKSLEEMEALRIRAEDLKKLRCLHPEISGIILERFAQAVAPRWKDSHQQIKSMLERAMYSAQDKS